MGDTSYGSNAYENFRKRIGESPLGRINSAFAESSIAIIDKQLKLKSNTFRILQDIHEDVGRLELIREPRYHNHKGKKDVFWLACFLTEKVCLLNPLSLGTFGRPRENMRMGNVRNIIFSSYETEQKYPHLISVQGWSVWLGVDSKDLDIFPESNFHLFVTLDVFRADRAYWKRRDFFLEDWKKK